MAAKKKVGRAKKPLTMSELSMRDLAALYDVSLGALQTWDREGVNIRDASVIAVQCLNARRCPAGWRKAKAALLEGEEADTHEHWKKEKTKEEVEKLRLANAKASGEMFDKVDGERVQIAWAAALDLALSELVGTAPQILAGKDEAGISQWLEEESHRIRVELSDLESELWKEVFDKYAKVDATVGRPSGSTSAKAPKDS